MFVIVLLALNVDREKENVLRNSKLRFRIFQNKADESIDGRVATHSGSLSDETSSNLSDVCRSTVIECVTKSCCYNYTVEIVCKIYYIQVKMEESPLPDLIVRLAGNNFPHFLIFVLIEDLEI